MEEDKKIENIKDGCKISVPIISNQELADFNNILDIESEYEKLIKKISEQVYKEKECILLQQIIKKQERTIENLIARNKELEKHFKEFYNAEVFTAKQAKLIEKDYIPKSKVREKIEEYEELVKDFEEYWSKDPRQFKKEKCVDYYKIEALKEFLQEGDK